MKVKAVVRSYQRYMFNELAFFNNSWPDPILRLKYAFNGKILFVQY